MSALYFGADVPCTCYNCCICTCVCPLACVRSCLVCLAGCTPCCGFCCGACASCIPEPTKIYQTRKGASVPSAEAPTSMSMDRQWFVL